MMRMEHKIGGGKKMSNRKYRFKVEDIPPKNVKPKSMWNNPNEVPHLIEFRKKSL